MRRLLISIGLTITLAVLVLAQDRPTQRDTKRRFGQVATRAIANFRAADSIERRLNDDGASLHPQLIALRMRVEASLEETRAAMDNGDFDAANEALDRAQGFLDKFAKKIGGE
jgi:hypothetical protein